MKKRKLNKLVGSWEPWDSEYNLRVEREMFRKQAEYFYTSNMIPDAKDISKKCQLLVSLLDIILDNTKDIEMFAPPKTKRENGISTLLTPAIWKLHKYVNTKNYLRFVRGYKLEWCEINEDFWKNELRVEKAWHLYHNLRIHYMRTFWD